MKHLHNGPEFDRKVTISTNQRMTLRQSTALKLKLSQSKKRARETADPEYPQHSQKRRIEEDEGSNSYLAPGVIATPFDIPAHQTARVSLTSEQTDYVYPDGVEPFISDVYVVEAVRAGPMMFCDTMDGSTFYPQDFAAPLDGSTNYPQDYSTETFLDYLT